jgi:hypothetical protein
MIDEARAREIAMAKLDAGEVVLGPGSELESGWRFPCISKKGWPLAGVIVDKQSGRVLRVMEDSPLDRDLTLYDRGYRFEACDVVVLTVADLDATVYTMKALRDVVVDVYYRYNRVYRVGRRITEDEIRERLTSLPAVFTCHLPFHIDELEKAREAGSFTFKIFEYSEPEG